MNTVEWNDLPTKKETGKEKVRCPSCDSSRSDKRDKSMIVYHKDGVAKCFYCEALSFKDDKDDNKTYEKDYTDISKKHFKSVLSNDKMVGYMSSRGISESTLERLYVTFEKYYQPAKGKEMDNIVFNYYEEGLLVNKKFRSGGKDFTQITGAKPILYNINSIIGQEEVWIVEGEMDVLSLYEVGIKNAVSVPNGANDNDEYWKNSEPYLKNIKKFVIATDNDEKGKILLDRIAQRLGRYRCEYVTWQNKDANDDLQAGVLEISIKNRKQFPVSGTFKVSDLKDNILDLYDNGLPDTIKPKAYYFNEFSDMFSVMRGQVSLGTGIPSHGKSNFTDWLVLNLMKDYNMKTSWFSPEHSPMELYHTNLMEKVIGKNFWKDRDSTMGKVSRLTKSDVEKYNDWANERIYLTGADGDVLPTWDWLLEKFKEQMFSYGIDIFVIDAFNKVLLPQGNRLEQINIVLTKLTHFAVSNNVIVFLVAHPTKMQKDQETGLYGVPTLYDVSGSADFRNQVHNGYSIYRIWENAEQGIEEGTDFYNMKTKFNFQGSIGEKVSFNYSTVNGRYYEKGTKEPLFCLIDGEKEDTIPTANPSEAFDDVPF